MMRFDHRNMANRRMRRLYPPVCGCGVRENICRTIEEQYNEHDYLCESGLLNDKEKDFYQRVTAQMPDSVAAASLRSLSDFLGRYYGKK